MSYTCVKCGKQLNPKRVERIQIDGSTFFVCVKHYKEVVESMRKAEEFFETSAKYHEDVQRIEDTIKELKRQNLIKENKMRNPYYDEESAKICPHCGALVLKGDVICSACSGVINEND